MLQPRPGVLEIAPYVGGKSTAGGTAEPIKLSSNEAALGASPRARAAFVEMGAKLHRYPDGGAVDLRAAIARHHDLDAARIVCSAGSDELISLLAKAYAGPGDEVLLSRHGFLMYPIAAHAAGATPVMADERNLTTDVDALLAKVTPATRIVFLANPNNPTGTYISTAEVRRLHAGLPDNVLLVLDAAYAEFVDAEDYEAGVRLVDSAENVIMLRTFSKLYGLAALRLGWGYGAPGIIDVLNRLRGPFNVSLPAQAAGVAALDDTDFTARQVAHNAEWRSWLSGRLNQLGLDVVPSVGNFILVKFPDRDGQRAPDADAFLIARGILVRRMEGYGLPGTLRISIGTGPENEALASALADFLRGA
jgi:histidinol-phosphate aminotransferase